MNDLLKPIERSTPDDYPEINARTWCYLSGKVFAGTMSSKQGFRNRLPNQFEETVFMGVVPGYTRSRDALKAIRPDGWFIVIRKGDRASAEIFKEGEFGGGFDYSDKRAVFHWSRFGVGRASTRKNLPNCTLLFRRLNMPGNELREYVSMMLGYAPDHTGRLMLPSECAECSVHADDSVLISIGKLLVQHLNAESRVKIKTPPKRGSH